MSSKREVFPPCEDDQCEFNHEGGCIIETVCSSTEPCPPKKRNNENLIEVCPECHTKKCPDGEDMCDACSEEKESEQP